MTSKHILIAFALIAVPATSRAERKIEGSFKQVTHDCRKDATVDIMSTLNQVTIVGPCRQVRVSGGLNQVTISSTVALVVAGDENQVRSDATDAINAPGGHNQIEYKRAVTPNKQTQVSSPGPNNDIRKVK